MKDGFNPERLARLEARLNKYADDKKVAGCALLITRHGRAEFDARAGFADVEANKPITEDSIFRFYSMSKPITMTALMQLYERGEFSLLDPLYEYIPEFKDMPVAVEQPDGSIAYEKQKQPITIKNLVTMTSGISYPGDDDAGARSISKLYDKYDAMPATVDAAKLVATEAALSFQPGEHWKYGFSHDVVGALIEVISGMRFGEYLKKHIFEPIGMTDTGFYVPELKRARLVTAYGNDESGALVRITDPDFYEGYYNEPAFESGGGGLAGTARDYSRFCQTLLNGGWSGDSQIIGRKTIKLITTNQLTETQTRDFDWRHKGFGYGVGMRTMLTNAATNGSAGEFGWDGMMGTWMAIDPMEDMTIVYMQNMMPYNDNGQRLMPLIYAALM